MQKWPEPNMKLYCCNCVEEQRETTKSSVTDNWFLCKNLECDPPNTKQECQLLTTMVSIFNNSHQANVGTLLCVSKLNTSQIIKIITDFNKLWFSMTSRSKIIYFYIILANQNSYFTSSTNWELGPVIAYTQKDTLCWHLHIVQGISMVKLNARNFW